MIVAILIKCFFGPMKTLSDGEIQQRGDDQRVAGRGGCNKSFWQCWPWNYFFQLAPQHSNGQNNHVICQTIYLPDRVVLFMAYLCSYGPDFQQLLKSRPCDHPDQIQNPNYSTIQTIQQSCGFPPFLNWTCPLFRFPLYKTSKWEKIKQCNIIDNFTRYTKTHQG